MRALHPPFKLPMLHLWLLLLLLLAGGGCKKVEKDRALSAAERQANNAIEAYSAASAEANAAHQAVLQSFESANRASDLSLYKAALREKVLPAMDAFVTRLKTMPTGTPELKRIHGQLLDAYMMAREEIAAFEHELNSVDGLQRFGEIRSRLQSGVRTYRESLAAYYSANKRQLKLDAPPAAANLSSAPTPTAPSAASTATNP